MDIPLNIDITQILLHVLNLVILVGGLALILYRPVAKFLRERSKHYADLEKELDEKGKECEALKAEYQEKLKEADDLLAKTRADSNREGAEIAVKYLNEAKLKADEIVKAAEAEAEARKGHILESAQVEIGELVLSAAQKLLGDAASPESDKALYDEFIKTYGNGGPEGASGNE